MPEGATLLLDTPVLIAYLEGGHAITETAVLLIDDWVRSGRNRAIVSAVSAMEIFVGPMRSGQSIDAYVDFLSRLPNVSCVPVDLTVAQCAARIRATSTIKPPDALIVGTAIAAGVDVIITNDDEWPKVSPKPVVLLGDYG
jgi:predicted nucleic acid-binding protein